VESLGNYVQEGLNRLGDTRSDLRIAMSGYSGAGGTFRFLKENMECPEESWKDLELQWEQRANRRPESLIRWADNKD
jgi:hypothetical protein